MACVNTDCLFIYNASILPPALQANPDISGIGVLIGFVGTAYTTFLMLVLRYLMGQRKDMLLEDRSRENPVDERVLNFIWRTVGRPPAHWEPALKGAVLALSDTQIVTGLAILISGFLQINCGLSIFHWHIMVSLAWFSSTTHLTSLTFLRRYIHDHSKIRILKLVLMSMLAATLATALVPTGGACGLQYAGQESTTFVSSDNTTIALTNGTEGTYPGAPAKCCFELSRHGHFISSNSDSFLSMVASEILLLVGTLNRAIKFFRTSSIFAEEWLSERPLLYLKRFIKRLEEKYHTSRVPFYFSLHCTLLVLMVYICAVRDIMQSILWEISWLLFSLAWGSTRLYSTRQLANMDSSRTGDGEGDVVLQENFWGFGQLTPVLLLILPVLSLAEGFWDTRKFAYATSPKSTVTSHTSQSDDVDDRRASARPDTQVNTIQSRLSSIGLASQEPPSYVDPYNELSRSTDIVLARRTGTDLSIMERRLGTGEDSSSGTLSRRQTSLSQNLPPLEVSPVQSGLHGTQQPWPSQKFFDHDFYEDTWYKEMLICMCLLVAVLGVEFNAFAAGVGTKTISSFVGIFASYPLYTSIYLLYSYPFMCIWIERRPQRQDRIVNFLSPTQNRKLYPLLRRILLGCVLIVNLPLNANVVTVSLVLGAFIIAWVVYSPRFRKQRTENPP